MSLLLDTHTFLWWILDNARLPASHRALISDPRNRIFVSVVSVWEIAIKAGAGKMHLPGPVGELIPEHIAGNRFDLLTLDIAPALRVADLPALHRDPFDRLLIAQSQVTGMPLLTSDPAVRRYPVTTLA